MDDISNIVDMKRLYQLYIMTDKILSTQMKSSSINYEELKKFKNIALRLNYLNMQKASLEIENLDYDTKDFYEEQKKLFKIVKAMEDAIKIRGMLVSKYRKYSALPLILEDNIGLDDYDYYKNKLNNINDYIQNEVYLSKFNELLTTLGINLGNKITEEEELLKLIPKYEDELKNSLCSNNAIKETLLYYEFDIDKILENEKDMSSVYEEVSNNYNEITDKYETMKLVTDSSYMDVINDITREYKIINTKKNIIEIIKLVLDVVSEYDDFIQKRNNIKECLSNIDKNIFDKRFIDLVDHQLKEISNIDTIRNELIEIKEDIHRNNSLISRINNEQVKLKETIQMKKEKYYEKILDNQVVNITSSYISYSKEKTTKVLKFIFERLNQKTDKPETDIIIEDKINKVEDIFINEDSNNNSNDNNNLFEEISDTNNLFESNSNVSEDDTNKGDNLFEDKLKADDIFNNQADDSKYFDKIESYDDIFTHNNGDLFNFENNVFNDKINAQIVTPKVQYLDVNNNFWPNIG